MSTATPDPSMAAAQRPLRAAASLLLVRPGTPGIEVLMLHRADKGDQFSGAWVFPGGIVDLADRDGHACCAGLDDAAASHRLGVAAGGLDYYVAAIRETFEEAGVLLGLDAQGRFPGAGQPDAATWLDKRHAIATGVVDFAAECRAQGLRLAADQLHYIAHWITPVGTPKRFDTRFFVAVLPPGQQVSHDGGELTDHGWFRPSDLLASRDHKLLAVTRPLLRTLARYDTVDALLAWAATPRQVLPVQRRRCQDANGLGGVMPDHPAWPEIGLLDPAGAGDAWCELAAGQVTALVPGVQRMAGTDGTPNAYLIGDASSGWVAIDAQGEAAARWLAASGASGATLLRMSDRQGTGRLTLGTWVLERLEAPDGGAAWLLAAHRMAFTGRWMPSAGDLPGADWAAPATGFLLPLDGVPRASGQ